MFNDKKKYSLEGKTNGTTGSNGKTPTPSSYLMRIADTAANEQKQRQAAPQDGMPRSWAGRSSIDHSTPASNLNSRLRWVETAFKPGEGGAPPQQQQVKRTVCAQAVQTTIIEGKPRVPAPQNPAPHRNNGTENRNAIIAMRKKLAILRAEMETMDRDLLALEQKLN